MKFSCSLLVALLIFASCTKVEQMNWEDGTWIDLTYEYSDETLYWPTSALFKVDTVFVGETEGGYYYEAFTVSTAEHGGTHLDAPIHFYETGKTVDEIGIDQLTGYAVVIDVTEPVAQNRDYQIQPSDITEWEQEHGQIPEGSILLFYTGMGAYWPDAEAYLGTANRGEEALSELSFPGIHPDAAQWIVENRNVKAVGLDTPSLDYGQSELYETHQTLFEHDIPGFENVANLDQLPTTGAYIIALPMKIKDGSGGPLRIVAHISE
ncbi:cyclase family protein [Rhodohalobacter sp. 614A]|uniref:cyclase family protein n=1 Tax=Rhodohalobacter sp. 614A TaxID=2908649 RepID=UPI001F467782|nr:cyclase family protein [Rhodohalobacter sp. 614A]